MAASGLARTCSRAISPYSSCMPITLSLLVPSVCSSLSTASWAFCARLLTLESLPPLRLDDAVVVLVGNPAAGSRTGAVARAVATGLVADRPAAPVVIELADLGSALCSPEDGRVAQARDVVRHVVDTQASTPSYAGEVITLERSVDDDPEAAWDEARDAMQALLDDPARARAMGAAGRAWVEQRWSWTTIAAGFADLLEPARD